MTYRSDMTDEQFTQTLQAILHRELGPGGFARFLRLYHSGTGDYTRDRHQWLDGITLEQLEQELDNKAA